MPAQNEPDQQETIDTAGKTDASQNPATDPRRVNERRAPMANRVSDRDEAPVERKGLDDDELEDEELEDDEREDADETSARPIPEESRDLNVSKPVKDLQRDTRSSRDRDR